MSWMSKISCRSERVSFDGPPEPASYSSVTPKRWAMASTASVNCRPSVSITKLMTSPALPQPKHLKKPLSAETLNDGVFSACKGQRQRAVQGSLSLPLEEALVGRDVERRRLFRV